MRNISLGFFALFLGVFLLTGPSFAADAKKDDADYARRLELAEKMHTLRSTRDQVYAAIDQVAQSQPEAEREAFRTAMRSILNYQAIERISIDTMVDVYTADELAVMVEYYSKPEAISAAKKDSEYARRVYPEITRMLDQALMKVRTGAGKPQ